MSIDREDLIKAVDHAREVTEITASIQLDAEVIAVKYNDYRNALRRPLLYEFRELQEALESLISQGIYDGSVSRVSSRIVKIVIF